MKKSSNVILIALIVLVAAVLVYTLGFNNSANMTYQDCVNNYLTSQRYLPSASTESIGAKRNDSSGNIWTKQSQDSWTSPFAPGTNWGDALVDEQPGGISYSPSLGLNGPKECWKYKEHLNKVFTQSGTYLVHDGDSFSMIGESGGIIVSVAPGDAASFPYVGFYNSSMNEELNLRESENGTFGKNQHIVIKVNSIDISSNSANVTFHPLPL